MPSRWLILLLALGTATAFAFGDFERGNRLFRKGRFAEAATAYRAALEAGNDRPEVHYNLGSALLRLGHYREAEEHLRGALAAVDPELRQRTYYNLGNRYLEEARGPAGAAQQPALLDAAIESYKQALRLRPADRAAKWNLELALRQQEQQQQSPQAGGSRQQQPQAQQPEQQQQTGGGGAGGERAQPGGGEQPGEQPQPLTREQAERILSAVEQDERELYRERLRQGRREVPVTRDW